MMGWVDDVRARWSVERRRAWNLCAHHASRKNTRFRRPSASGARGRVELMASAACARTWAPCIRRARSEVSGVPLTEGGNFGPDLVGSAFVSRTQQPRFGPPSALLRPSSTKAKKAEVLWRCDFGQGAQCDPLLPKGAPRLYRTCRNRARNTQTTQLMSSQAKHYSTHEHKHVCVRSLCCVRCPASRGSERNGAASRWGARCSPRHQNLVRACTVP